MYKVEIGLLLNESDVEQKVVLPLISRPNPEGLGFSKTDIQTKFNLKKLPIEKRGNTKLYYPDYLLFSKGMPCIVIEVKKPTDNLEEAFREARLYSLEVNSYYPENVNPCSKILATNGKYLLAGFWDNNQPTYEIGIENWLVGNSDFTDFVDSFSTHTVEKSIDVLRDRVSHNKRFKKPIHLLGGRHIQNQLIKNSFGESISLQYRHIFNPTTEDERTEIVKNAYVKVPKHLAHVTPIDRLIRKKVRPSFFKSEELEDNTVPKEIIDKLERASEFNNEVLLLIGSVGSGKTTFTTYLKEVALERDLAKRISWVRIDLNQAPVSTNEIYRWLKREICHQLTQLHPEIDVNQINIIKDIYRLDINNFNKTALELFEEESAIYKEKLFNKIQDLQSDLDLTLRAFIHYFVHSRGKELVLILDNCDKRNTEEQLLMFEVANWLKENTKSIVFLPLRETTFDNYRHQKPLDTVIKDLIFRINPPSLEKVLYTRIKYSARLSENNDERYYHLDSGIRVSYPSSEELKYLKSILQSLFQNNFFNRLITGLTGRDIRQGIEIFLDFCKSGHISDDLIFNMKQSGSDFELPNHVISKVFLRGNRLYYSDSDARIRNLFFSEPSDDLADPFVRISILKWLNDRLRKRGPSGLTGFFPTRELIHDLTTFGHSKERVEIELAKLITSFLVMSESQGERISDENELISINSSGITHLYLLENVDYLSSCAEDTWFDQELVAENISRRISGGNRFSHFSIPTAIDNSRDLAEYMKEYSKVIFGPLNQIHQEDYFNQVFDVNKLSEAIDDFSSAVNFKDYESKYIRNGEIRKVKIVNTFDYGIICEFKEEEHVGLIHVRNLNRDPNEYEVGTYIKVRVGRFRKKHNKYDLEIVE